MDSEAPVGGKRRGFRRWRRVILLLSALPVLVFLASNVLLSSSWSRRWIASKIERRTGLETRIGAASWSPWNGATLHTLDLLQPPPLRSALKQPLLRIDSLRVIPVWPAWLRGRLEIRTMELNSPRFVLPVELLSTLSQSAAPAAPPVATSPPPAVATVTPPPAVVPAPPPPVTDATKPPPIPAALPQPTGWLRMKNASFAVVHAGSQRNLFEASGITGGIPVSGDPAKSSLKIGSVSALGNELAAGLTPTLDWKFPLLSLNPLEVESGGYQMLIAAKIGTLSGLPLQIEAQLPSQPLEAISLPLDGQATAESISVQARFRGLLLAPATWQGDFVAETVSPSLRIAAHEAKFDSGRAVTVLRGGMLSCVDARLIGDELSLLGNATLLADGRCAGVARLVAPPETAANIAARILPGVPGARPLTPLATPQRVAFDLEAFGNIGQLFLRLGNEGPVVNFNP